MSHDTNILYLGNLLDLNWIPYGHTTGTASTGASLQFELWKLQEDGSFYVKVRN